MWFRVEFVQGCRRWWVVGCGRDAGRDGRFDHIRRGSVDQFTAR
jgi:hypothetical protein